MRALLDINVLIALLDSDHPFHESASSWLKTQIASGWASCPLTQNGCVRIMSQPGYPNAVPASVIIERLRDAVADPSHVFWPDNVSLLDPGTVDATQVHGPRQVTDIYLLSLAFKNNGQFVTFDHGIPVAAVKGATTKHLLVLGSGGLPRP